MIDNRGTGGGMSDAQRALAIQVARRRGIKGLLLAELAVKADVPYPLMVLIERGEADPTLRTISKIAAALDCRAEVVLSPPSTWHTAWISHMDSA